jgi:hypothetical protein
MPKFTAPIRRKETARGHHYADAQGRRVPGVTTIIGDGVPKPALINWAANATAEYAVDNWDRLGDLTPSARLKELQGARYAVKDAAANKGTQIHRYAEELLAGKEVQAPEELAGHVESYVRFLDEWQVEPVHVEFTAISYKYGYAGTGDLICYVTMPDGSRRLLITDLKSNRSGIFGETALQIAAYRHAEVLIGADGVEQAMPEFDGAAAVHVRGDGYGLVPVTAEPEQHRSFLYAKEVGGFVSISRDLIGPAMEPPRDSAYRLVRGEVT